MSEAPDYLEQVREVAEGFEVFGELGRKSDDDVWFLARESGTTPLVALRLHRHRVDDRGEPVFALEVAKQLGSDVAMGEGDCISCRANLRSFARFCSKCGSDQTAGTQVAASDAERAAQLDEVRAAASELYDVLGEMPWVTGAGAVYFAIEKKSGGLVRLRLRRSDDGLELGENQVGMGLSGAVTASYVTQVGAPAPVVRLRASAPTPVVRQPRRQPPSAPTPPGPPPQTSARERNLTYAVAALGVIVVVLLILLIAT